MKKDKKFLLDLEKELKGISKKKKDAIVLKYRKLIDEQLSEKKKITVILKSFGTPESVAEMELAELKGNKINIKEMLMNIFSIMKNIFVKTGSSIKNFFIKFYKGITKDIQIKPKKDKVKKDKKLQNKKDKTKDKKVKTNKFKDKFKNLFKKKQPKTVIQEAIEDVEETFEDVVDEVNDVAELVTSKPIFMTKAQRRKNIIIKTLGLILVTIMLLIWLWIDVLFVASMFAFLDGVKIFGVNITLFGLAVLVLWIIVMVNKIIFKRKNHFRINLIITLVSVFIIAVGIALTIYQLSKVEEVSDVSQKYSMTTKVETYNLPSNEDKVYIEFNANYDTQYMVKYDDKLNGKFKIEVKYYENYYDYYMKKTSNNIYVSLSKDTRDRISSYINDFKENKVYKEEELQRYTVKITINEKYYQRLVIEN